MRVTHRILALAAAGLFGVGGQLHAQQIEFKGTTQGCFYDRYDSPCAPATASLDGLALGYLRSPFDVTTNASGYSSVNLGWLGLLPGVGNFNGDHFLLDVFFSSPTVSGTPAVFEAALQGRVFFGLGGVSLDFDPGQIFSFNSDQGSGTFSLNVRDMELSGFDLTPLRGDIQINSFTGSTTATPEPATFALMATGFLGLIPMYRMRRKKNEA